MNICAALDQCYLSPFRSLLPPSPTLAPMINSYKVLCEDHCEFLKLWSGYVYWARGQVKLTLSAFSTALNSLKYGKHIHYLWLGSKVITL